MTKQDQEALAFAVAQTFNDLLAGRARRGNTPLSAENIKDLLYYNINPWNTEASFDFLAKVSQQINDED